MRRMIVVSPQADESTANLDKRKEQVPGSKGSSDALGLLGAVPAVGVGLQPACGLTVFFLVPLTRSPARTQEARNRRDSRGAVV